MNWYYIRRCHITYLYLKLLHVRLILSHILSININLYIYINILFFNCIVFYISTSIIKNVPPPVYTQLRKTVYFSHRFRFTYSLCICVYVKIILCFVYMKASFTQLQLMIKYRYKLFSGTGCIILNSCRQP